MFLINVVCRRIQKCANFETMDKEKIDHIFKEWQDKSLLTEDGALKVAHAWHLLVALIYLSYPIFTIFVVPYILNIFKNGAEVLFFILSFLVCYFFLVLFLLNNVKKICPEMWYYYKDRIEVRCLWGLRRKTYNYSDIKRVVCESSKYTMVLKNHVLSEVKDEHEMEFLRTCFAPLCVEREAFHKEEYKGEIRHFANRICFKTMPGCQTKALQDALAYFEESPKYFKLSDPKEDLSFWVEEFMFSKRLFYKYMLWLFANMICLKTGDSYQDAGYQRLLKYLSESIYRKYDYVHDLSEYIERFRGYKTKGSIPSRYTFVNICLSIMKISGPDYADRLELLTHLFECAYASDDMVDEEELNRLSRIAFYLCIKDWDFLSLRYRFETEKQSQKRQHEEDNARQRERYQFSYSSRKREAYNLLGLNVDATLEEVKSAYRTQVKTCHPDTLPSTATIKEREEASQRFRTITEAYDFLCAELCAEPVGVAR